MQQALILFSMQIFDEYFIEACMEIGGIWYSGAMKKDHTEMIFGLFPFLADMGLKNRKTHTRLLEAFKMSTAYLPE